MDGTPGGKRGGKPSKKREGKGVSGRSRVEKKVG